MNIEGVTVTDRDILLVVLNREIADLYRQFLYGDDETQHRCRYVLNCLEGFRKKLNEAHPCPTP